MCCCNACCVQLAAAAAAAVLLQASDTMSVDAVLHIFGPCLFQQMAVLSAGTALLSLGPALHTPASPPVPTIDWCCCCRYGTMGLGAVLHTLNPRLFAAELEYIVNHAQDQYICVDLTFVPLMAQLQDKLRCVRGFIVLTDGQHMPRDSKLRDMLCYEELLQVRPRTLMSCSRRVADQRAAQHAVQQKPLQVCGWTLTGLIGVVAQHLV